MNYPIRILLVDDQTTIRQALQMLLEQEPTFRIVGGAANGESGLALIEETQPDIALVDIEMPGMDGITLTEIISQRYPAVKVLVLSGQDEPDYLRRSFQAGAKGYLLKNTPVEDLVTAIQAIQRGYGQVSPGLLEKLMLSPPEVALPTDPSETTVWLSTQIANLEPLLLQLLGLTPQLNHLQKRVQALQARLAVP